MSSKDHFERNKYNHVIGPPSTSAVQLEDFLEESVKQSELWKTAPASLTQATSQWSDAETEAVAQRCSVDDLAAETQEALSDDGKLQDLRLWHWARLFSGSEEDSKLEAVIRTTMVKKRNAPAKQNKGKAAAADAASRSQTPVPGHAPSAGPEQPPQDVDQEPSLLPESIHLIRQRFETSPLLTLKPFKDSPFYMRKTRQADAQSLDFLKTALPIHLYHEFSDALALQEASTVLATAYAETQVLVTVLVHAVSSRLYGFSRSDPIAMAARQQRIVLLGSNTLGDLRDAIISPGNTCPVEEPANESSMDVDGEDDAQQPQAPTKSRYIRERWKSAAAMIINGSIYVDTRQPSDIDHASILKEAASVGVQPEHQAGGTAIQAQPGATSASNDQTTRLTSSSSMIASLELSDGTMEDTELSDIMEGVHLRQPCYLLQQGLFEHVFEIEDIRLLHATDPAPVFQEHNLYPITTYLSRMPISKCDICEKDPATRTTLHDELAGVSPCRLCELCFQYLHVDDESAKAKGVDVIPIIDDLLL